MLTRAEFNIKTTRKLKLSLKAQRAYTNKKYLANLAEFVGEMMDVDIKSSSRKRENVMARLIYYHVASRFIKASIRQIGEVVDRDHATVVSALKKDYLVSEDREYKRYIEICVDWLHKYVFESKLNKKQSYTKMIGIMSDEIKRLEGKISLITDGRDFGVYEDHEIKFRALTEPKKELYRERVTAILKMMH